MLKKKGENWPRFAAKFLNWKKVARDDEDYMHSLVEKGEGNVSEGALI